MKNNEFIYGFRKKLIDLGLLRRIFTAVCRKYGLFRTFRLLSSYFKHPHALLRSAPNRYARIARDVIAVPDLPPVNSEAFIDRIVQDMEWLVLNEKPGLVFAIVCVTSRCPFSCPYCYNSNLHTNSERLDVSLLIAAIQALSERGATSIYLSGGEPMMRYNDVLSILDHFKNSNIRFWMLTTGWGMTTEKAAGLVRAGLKGVMVSLDSFDENRINEVKGSPRAFSNALKAIAIARENELIVAVDAVLSKSMLKESSFGKFIDTASRAGVHFVNAYTPRQMFESLNDDYSNFSLQDFEKLGKRIADNQKSSLNKKMPVCFSPDLWEAGRGCVGGKLFVYIDPEGNVKKCPFVDFSLGNIRAKPVNEILDGAVSDIENHICATNTMLSRIPMQSC